MSKFSELIDAVADQKGYSLTDVLLRAKVLSHHLSGRRFRQWVDSELNGYSSKVVVPKYRIVSARLLGRFDGPFGSSQSNVPLSTTHLPAEIREQFDKQAFSASVSYIEDLVKGNGGVIGQSLDGFVVNYFRANGMRISEMILNHVFASVSRHSLTELLINVRSRLLDFLLEIRDKYPELDKDDDVTGLVTGSDVDTAIDRKVYQNCTVIEGDQMGDSYQAGQAGAMGPHAKAENMNFVMILREAIGQMSLGELAKELESLRGAMLPSAVNAEHDLSIAEIAHAEEAAKKGDAAGVLGHLKAAGQWAIDVATGIGASVAQKALEKSMGLSEP